jgi:hypothetical protein
MRVIMMTIFMTVFVGMCHFIVVVWMRMLCHLYLLCDAHHLTLTPLEYAN